VQNFIEQSAAVHGLSRPGHTKFLFSGHKKFEISGHFSGHQSQKTRFFVISGAYNFGMLFSGAKITIRAT